MPWQPGASPRCPRCRRTAAAAPSRPATSRTRSVCTAKTGASSCASTLTAAWTGSGRRATLTSNYNFKQKREELCLSKECVRTGILLWRKMEDYWPRNVLQMSVSFLNDWNLITTTLTGQGNIPVGMWHWNELGNINLDPKQDLGRKLYFFFQCLLRADLNGSIWSHFTWKKRCILGIC